MDKKIGIIGFGNMGSVLAQQLKVDYRLYVFDKDITKINQLRDMQAASSIIDLVNKVNTVILAVKPQDFETVLNEVKAYSNIADRLIISIAAGITTAYIENILGISRVVRAMPNLAAKIGQGITCLSKGKYATEEDFDFAEDFFEYVGQTLRIEEGMMNPATAISGSGPGYYFDAVDLRYEEYKSNPQKFQQDFIVDLTRAAEATGFDTRTARSLAHLTVACSDLLLQKTGLPPGELTKQVTSKGGTTEAALEVLHRGGSLTDAVKVAVERAKQLSRG